jgi:rhodanese-related sulfurtransferase
VAHQLQELGFNAAALLGGFNAWRAAYPVEPRASSPPLALVADE